MTKRQILDAALGVLRRGESLTLDAVARDAGLTKPGVVHHFATKEVLALAVVDQVLDGWQEQLQEQAGPDAGPAARLRAYVSLTLLGPMDAADLAVLADPKLRTQLCERWNERLDTWFGDSRDPRFVAARLVADGAWIDRCLGLLDLDETERRAVVAVADTLVEQGSTS